MSIALNLSLLAARFDERFKDISGESILRLDTAAKKIGEITGGIGDGVKKPPSQDLLVEGWKASSAGRGFPNWTKGVRRQSVGDWVAESPSRTRR